MGQFSKADERPEMDLKYLEQKVDFILHLSMAYPLITPTPKRLDLTRNY